MKIEDSMAPQREHDGPRCYWGFQNHRNRHPRLFSERTLGRHRGMPLDPMSAEQRERLLGKLRDRVLWPADESDPPEDNPGIPAGYTYFGQLLAHDLSFLSLATHSRAKLRTPRLDLDSLYGGGPLASPQYYVRDQRALFHYARGVEGSERPDDDLPRNHYGIAVIPDPRDDVHVLVSQMHLCLMKAHNRIVHDLRAASAAPRSPEDEFWTARRCLSWHYHSVVLEDYLPRILDEDRQRWLRDSLERLRRGRAHHSRFFEPEAKGVPLEFSVAAFRFAHSMVRSHYALNDQVRRPLPIGYRPTPDASLSGFRPLVPHWTVDWHLFVDGSRHGSAPAWAQRAGRAPQLSKKIGPRISAELAKLPPGITPDHEGRSLPERSLLRSLEEMVTTGQEASRAIGVKSEVDTGSLPRGLRRRTPLWLYVLLEAEQLEKGLRLGPVGSTIVAEVFVGTIAGDPNSFLHPHRHPSWRPRVPQYDLADLLFFGAGAD